MADDMTDKLLQYQLAEDRRKKEKASKPKDVGSLAKQTFPQPAPQKKTLEELASEMYGSLNLGSKDKPMAKYESLDPSKGDFGTDPLSNHPSMQDMISNDPDLAAKVSTALGNPMPSPSSTAPVASGSPVQASGAQQATPLPSGTQMYNGGPKGASGGSMTTHTVAPQQLPGQEEYVKTGMSNADDMGSLAEQVPEQQQEREGRVAKIVSDFNAEQDTKNKDLLADQAARQAGAQKALESKIDALEHFQPKSLFERSPGRAIAAMIGMALGGALQGLTNGKAGGDIMQMISRTLHDDAKEQWDVQQTRVGAAKSGLEGLRSTFNNEMDFRSAQMAAGWKGVAAQVDGILKQPLPAEIKQKALVLGELARSRYSKAVVDLAHSQEGRSESWQEIQLMAKQSVAQSGGYSPTKDPFNRLDPRSKTRVNQELQKYLKETKEAGIPQMREPMSVLASTINAPGAEQHINTIKTTLMHMGNTDPGPGGFNMRMAALNQVDPKAAEFYQHLQNVVNQFLKARSGSAVTDSESERFFKAALGAGDYNGVRRGLTDMQKELDSMEDHWAIDLSDDAAATLAYRRAAGGVAGMHPQNISSEGGPVRPSASQYGAGNPAAQKNLEKPTEGRPLLKGEDKLETVK